MLPGVKQATFSGAQLRAGASAYGLMTAGLFGPANWPAVKEQALVRKRQGTAHTGDVPPYDWGPYITRFWDKLPEDAVSATMIAVGELMHSLHGYNESRDRPSRAERARSLAQQARAFVLGMLEPLFGTKHTPKLHGVLCHIGDEVQLRDDLSMADTSLNEQKHKEEKAAYKLTNRQSQIFARQQLKVTQSRLILQAEKDRLSKDAGAKQGMDADKSGIHEHDGDDVPAALKAVGVGETGGEPMALEELCGRPGLSRAASVLGLPAYAVVSILSFTHFTATYAWGALPGLEVVRSSELYHNAAWHDDVMYKTADGHEVMYGRIRCLLARGSAGKREAVAVLQHMKLAKSLSGSPSSAAGYKRLCWAFATEDAEWPIVEAVTVDRLLRIVHVLPDVELLDGSRRAVDRRAAVSDALRDQFFLVKKLFKSTTPAQQQSLRSELKVL